MLAALNQPFACIDDMTEGNKGTALGGTSDICLTILTTPLNECTLSKDGLLVQVQVLDTSSSYAAYSAGSKRCHRRQLCLLFKTS